MIKRLLNSVFGRGAVAGGGAVAPSTEANSRKALQTVAAGMGGWWPLIREPYAGAWQKNDEWTVDTVLAFYAVYTCVSLISSDIGKMRIKLVANADGIWEEIDSPAFSPVLKRPNHYQNHIQFKEWWLTSKLSRGNTYVLKQRDNRGVVIALYILDPLKTLPLVADDGSIYYQLSIDNLSGLTKQVTVPASEIIHDRMNCMFHPLVGVSPLYACGMAANSGLTIQKSSADFFGNASRPGGVLSAPGHIEDDTAKRLKDYWVENYTGENAGRVAVLGDGLKFEAMSIAADDAQLVEQLKLTAQMVAATYRVPFYMVDTSTAPSYNNIDALNQQYYSQCLQVLIESFELCMDEGLGLNTSKGNGIVYGTELDLSTLLRMDTKTKIESMTNGVKGGIFSPNEARATFDLRGVDGGETPYLQQQNYSLAALSKRDAKTDPFATTGSSNLAPANALPDSSAPSPDNEGKELDTDEIVYLSRLMLEKELKA